MDSDKSNLKSADDVKVKDITSDVVRLWSMISTEQSTLRNTLADRPLQSNTILTLLGIIQPCCN